ncbi:hypothetical protein D3C87_87880 [compost metagenome]
MKFLIGLSFLLVTYFLYGFYINQYEMSVVPQQIKSEHASDTYDYKGVLNVHTELSIGSASASFVIQSAKMADLDFVFFTDLNKFNMPTSLESYHGNLLVFSGAKYSYLDSRLLFYSLDRTQVGDNLGEVQVTLADLLSQKQGASKDTLLVLAHPYKAGFSWVGEIPTGLDGFELLNLKSLSNRAWQDSKASTIWSGLIYPFNPRLAFARLLSEPRDEIALLDRLSQERKINIYAGTEASARAIPLANYLMRFPSYKRSFEIMSNHILLRSELTGNFNNDRQKVFNALKNGNFYIALDILGDTKGFQATLVEPNKSHLMGSEVKLSKGLSLSVKLPSVPKDFYEIIVYRNGVVFGIFNEPEFVKAITEPGTYRVQVRVIPMLPLPDAKKWLTWIYTNPFYVVP